MLSQSRSLAGAAPQKCNCRVLHCCCPETRGALQPVRPFRILPAHLQRCAQGELLDAVAALLSPCHGLWAVAALQGPCGLACQKQLMSVCLILLQAQLQQAHGLRLSGCQRRPECGLAAADRVCSVNTPRPGETKAVSKAACSTGGSVPGQLSKRISCNKTASTPAAEHCSIG